ncbi:MAG: LeuD/DmdB family oxidoreductase small subunit [Candidatus Hodarchaeales archaeon]|jgi:3-isopropylmalate/(R)-2-methylmalate dehydratase small subunit
MTKKPLVLTGRAIVIRDEAGKGINNIDTDMIFHNKHLHITDITQMGQHAFGNLEGWIDFPQKVQKSDILVVGQNFGAGSSRQQAVDCFIALGVQTIVGESFGAIYKRNVINTGLPLMIANGIMSKDQAVTTGDILEIDLSTGKIINKNHQQNQKSRNPRGSCPIRCPVGHIPCRGPL